MQIKKQLVPKNKWNIKCPNTMKPQYITVHNTANDASAANEIAYMTRNNHATSYHYAVDDKEIIQAVLDNRNAWHCGDGPGKGNMTSIGVEICYSKSGGERDKKAEENAVQLVAYLLKKHKRPISRVKQHNCGVEKIARTVFEKKGVGVSLFSVWKRKCRVSQSQAIKNAVLYLLNLPILAVSSKHINLFYPV